MAPSPTHRKTGSAPLPSVTETSGCDETTPRPDGGDAQTPVPPPGPFGKTDWQMVRSHWLRQGCDHHEAEDLTQEFFLHLLKQESLTAAARSGSHFHRWLMTALRNFQINEWRRASRLKRGGGKKVHSLDAMDRDQRKACEPVDRHTPETAYEQRWLEAVLDGAKARVRRDYEAAGQGGRFEALQTCLLKGDGSVTGKSAAQQLGLSDTAVRTAVYKLRQRYKTAVREEFAGALTGEAGVEDEIRCLLAALGGSVGFSAS